LSFDDDEYVFVRETRYVRKKIPKDHVKCPVCDGSGEVRLYYGQPWDRGQFTTCWCCHGDGYISREWLEDLKKMPLFSIDGKVRERIKKIEEKKE